MAWASTAGFHHGSSRKTYSAAVRFSPRPPAFRLIRKSGQSGSFWKRSTRASRSRVCAVEVLVGRRRARRGAGARSPSRLVNCENTSALWPSSRQLLRVCGSSTSSLADGSSPARCVEQARMAGGLPQAQQRLEDLDLGAIDSLAFDLAVAALRGSGRAARRRACAASAPGRSRASARSSAAALGDLLLRAAQDERPQRLSRVARRPGSSFAAACGAQRLECRGATRACRDSGTRTGSTARPGGSRPACRSAPGDVRRAAGARPWPISVLAFLIACASSRTT